MFAVVLTTVGSDEDAARLADALVERRLAACVTVVGPVRSTYVWKDELHRDEERLLLVKTRTELVSALGEALRELHPYELPELLVLPVAGGDDRYLAWLSAGTAGEETRQG